MVGKTSCTSTSAFRQSLVLESERAPADMALGLSRSLDCVLLKSSRNSGGTELLRLHRQRRIIRLGADKDPEPGLLVDSYDRCRRFRSGVELKHKSMDGVSDVPADKEARQPFGTKVYSHDQSRDSIGGFLQHFSHTLRQTSRFASERRGPWMRRAQAIVSADAVAAQQYHTTTRLPSN